MKVIDDVQDPGHRVDCQSILLVRLAEHLATRQSKRFAGAAAVAAGRRATRRLLPRAEPAWDSRPGLRACS